MDGEAATDAGEPVSLGPDGGDGPERKLDAPGGGGWAGTDEACDWLKVGGRGCGGGKCPTCANGSLPPEGAPWK